MEPIGDDELTSIFNRINSKNDRKSFSQVSKQFMKAACIRLHTLRNSFPDLLYDILPASPNLVKFYCCKPLSNNHIILLAQSCPKLSELDLNLEANSEGAEFDFDDDSLFAVANNCNGLFDVNLSRRLHVGDLGVCSLIRTNKNLQYLDLGRCANVTDESLEAIGKLTGLEYLNLGGCNLITDLGLKYLGDGNVKNCLTELDLSECDRITDAGIIYLKQMVTLTHLNLSRCGVNVTDSGVVALLSQLLDIEILDLSWLINVTDISLCFIATKCLNLCVIMLAGCEAITGEGLRAFAPHPTLLNLELFSCRNISWEDVKSLALTCIMLKNIRVDRRIKMLKPDNDVGEINNKCRIIWE